MKWVLCSRNSLCPRNSCPRNSGAGEGGVRGSGVVREAGEDETLGRVHPVTAEQIGNLWRCDAESATCSA
jgi:hypothetical protein